MPQSDPEYNQTPSTPQQLDAKGHPLPRRPSPANSVTLKHHRAAREASLRASAGSVPAANTDTNTTTSLRNSPGESHGTGQSGHSGHSGQSNGQKWFDHSNKNPTANYDSHAMDIDPPFFQRQSDSSNEDKAYLYPQMAAPALLTGARSSSADEYRSVIDDLTVEIQKLKDELKRYKQKGPDMLRKDKLFEVKIHGLPKRKRRELEATLRDFTASLEGSPDIYTSQRNRVSSRHATRDRMHAGSGSNSKHASSSSGSNTRPLIADSAYHSMSTGPHSTGTSLGRPTMTSRARSSEQKVESYLRDIPEGLYPRHVMMTDKEKKKIVVRRLEQLFTGKIKNNQLRRVQQYSSSNSNGAQNSNSVLAPVVSEDQPQQKMIHQPPSLEAVGVKEPNREARILPPEQQSFGKKSRSRDNGSSNSAGDQTESGGNGNGHGGNGTSPTLPQQPEQRPTRLKDLDPDRVQVPSENMDYIKHLGLIPPELISAPAEDVHPDADGWVYLNLLCNLAQLHIINVTPAFVRSAVSQMSTKFQVSPDGRKIRWRGGDNGTKFSSDSSEENSGNGLEVKENDGKKDESRKRQKVGAMTGNESQSGGSSKRESKYGTQPSAYSDSFHYKPMFVRQELSNGQTSMDDTLSSFGPAEDSNMGDYGWGQSGTGSPNRRKRRHDGAIIYYSGAPFCTDLSGDPGDVSPTTYMTSSGQDKHGSPTQLMRPPPWRSDSGSSLGHRPLSEHTTQSSDPNSMDLDTAPGLAVDAGDDSSEVHLDLTWSEERQFMDVQTLEPCGLGGVLPDDHFMVVVTTKRPKDVAIGSSDGSNSRNNAETTESIINRLASMSTSSPGPHSSFSPESTTLIVIEYVSGRIKRLQPVRLPPPAIFFPPFSSGSDSSYEEQFSDSLDKLTSEELVSRRANLYRSDDYPDNVDLTSGDEDGEEPENEPDTRGMYDNGVAGRQKSSTEGVERSVGSSVATAGGLGSGDESSGGMSS